MSSSVTPAEPIRVAILTVSDATARGEREDVSGPLLAKLVTAQGMEVVARDTVADVRGDIAGWLRHWAAQAEVLLTTGGTGLGPRDVTPEATRDVISYEVPGITEALRVDSLHHTPMAMLSRAVAGVVDRTVIVNLPGSPRAVEQQFRVLGPVLAHAVALLHGVTAHPPAEDGAAPHAD